MTNNILTQVRKEQEKQSKKMKMLVQVMIKTLKSDDQQKHFMAIDFQKTRNLLRQK